MPSFFILLLAGFFIGSILVVMIVSSLKQLNRYTYDGYVRKRSSRAGDPDFEKYAREKDSKSNIFTFLTVIASLVGLFGAFAEFSGVSLSDAFAKVSPNQYQMSTQLQQRQVDLKKNIDYDILVMKNELSDTTKTKEIKDLDSILLRLSRIEKNIDSLQYLYNKDRDR